MQKNRIVIIFARAPIYGRVKRRLAIDIGNLRACRFYRQNLQKLISELCVGPWQLAIATASAQDAKHPMFKGLPVVTQPHGDLGHRMRTVLERFDQRQVIIVGSDIHKITRAHIENSFSTLKDHSVVFGPAYDGGFWMVGRGRGYTPAWRFMRGVRWSTQYALEDSLATMPSGMSAGFASRLHDVDDGSSYCKLYDCD